MCHFKQILSIDRDQTETASAIRAFEDFLKLYPDSPYDIEAREKLNEAKTVMAKNSLYIGKFYLKKKKLEAACKRFQYVKANFPDIGLDQEIDKLITQSCKH
jgi:outer membrane protein assembly factor BamD